LGDRPWDWSGREVDPSNLPHISVVGDTYTILLSSEDTGGRHSLTGAERRVATLIGSGHTNKSAAAELGVSVNTVGTHLRAVFGKLGVQSRVQLANELHE